MDRWELVAGVSAPQAGNGQMVACEHVRELYSQNRYASRQAACALEYSSPSKFVTHAGLKECIGRLAIGFDSCPAKRGMV